MEMWKARKIACVGCGKCWTVKELWYHSRMQVVSCHRIVKKYRNYIRGSLGIGLFCFLLTLSGCGSSEVNAGTGGKGGGSDKVGIMQSEERKADQQGLSVHFLKVGKADCIFIFTETETVLIDTAEEGDGKKILNYLAEHGRNRIDHLILTHYDKDHVGGADIVLQKIPTGHIYAPDYEEESEPYKEYKKVVKEASLKEELVTRTRTIELSNANLCMEPSMVKNTIEKNEHSMIVSLYHGNNAFLFAGDVMGKRSQELIINDIGSYQVLKVPHHGKADLFNESLFDRIHPEIAVITDSDKNPAEAETMELLEKIGAEIYETRNGTIVMDSDGSEIIVSVE